MGPIQTAIGQALGAVSGAALVGKKLNEEDAKQNSKEEGAKEAKNGADGNVAAKAIKTAQDKKIDSPKQLYFWGDSEEPLGTSNEVAYVLANQSLHNAISSKQRSRDKVRERKQMLAKRKLVRK